MKQQDILYFFFLIILPGMSFSQDTDRRIVFPDTKAYQTLVCDFHIHTVFSDGSVWPDIRIEEAIKDGLDAVALTEHIEYQPHIEDIPHPDRNRSYILAKEYAKPYDLIVIHGAEITRNLPPGHANAIFIRDANALNLQDSIKAYKEAHDQGAFIFWNHPNWLVQQETAIPAWSNVHQKLWNLGHLNGIEVVNDITFSTEALDLALSKGLTVMGTSDIHGLVDWQYDIPHGGHRPVCLVLAKEKTEEAIKEALFAGRTIAWFKNILAGREEWVTALLNASLGFDIKGYIGPSRVLEVDIVNRSDASFILQYDGPVTFYSDNNTIDVPAQGHRRIQIIMPHNKTVKEITFKVLNTAIGNNRNAQITVPLE